MLASVHRYELAARAEYTRRVFGAKMAEARAAFVAEAAGAAGDATALQAAHERAALQRQRATNEELERTLQARRRMIEPLRTRLLSLMPIPRRTDTEDLAAEEAALDAASTSLARDFEVLTAEHTRYKQLFAQHASGGAVRCTNKLH